MSFPARRSGALRAQMLDKRVWAHTCDPVSHVPHSVKHKRGCHRWFYTCSCLAFSTLVVSVFVTQHDTVTSTFGSQTARPRFQLTAANTSELLAFLKESVLFPSFMTKIYHSFFFLRPPVPGRGAEPLVAFCSLNILLIVSMDKTVPQQMWWSGLKPNLYLEFIYHSRFIPFKYFFIKLHQMSLCESLYMLPVPDVLTS